MSDLCIDYDIGPEYYGSMHACFQEIDILV